MIEVKSLAKKYGNFLAVDNLSFTVQKGEVVGLLGPNGAGKSTTMNMITGYISSTEGTVTINGYDIFEEAEEAKKHIGYLPEQPPVYMDMKVIEYLQFVAELKKVKKADRATMIHKIMEDTKLLEVKNRLIRHLSKGYKQRVGIAGALIGYPDVIILDEPTVGLDPKQIIEIRDLIKKLAKKHTIILSSHILSEVSAVCERVIIINKGKLIVDDTPEKLADHARFATGVKIVARGDKGNIIGALTDVESIEDVSVEKEEDGFVWITVCGKENREIREDVFYKLAEEKIPIYMMQKSTLTLEDIFLELTKEDVKEAM